MFRANIVAMPSTPHICIHRHSPVNGVVLPATALLDPNAAPFRLGQQARLGKRLGQFLGENDVPVCGDFKKKEGKERQSQ